MQNPWRSTLSSIEDPILSLSKKNFSLERRNSSTNKNDRYVFGDLKKSVLNNTIEADQEEQCIQGVQTSLNETLRKKEQRKLYNKLLHSSIRTNSRVAIGYGIQNQKNTYQPRNFQKSGYLLGNLQNLARNTQSSLFGTGARSILCDLQLSQQEQQSIRVIAKHPYKILDAPKLKDDFYNNLLDWSKDDLISVVLDGAAYVWSGKGFQAQKLTQGYISSIKWGRGLVIGQQNGKTRIIDAQKKLQTFRYKAHTARIGTIDTFNNLIATGSKDTQVMIWDVRDKSIASRLQGHRQEVCGVRWSMDGSLLASGGNDNIVHIWQPRMHKAIGKFTEHVAAVKALAWSPHKNSLLATGGGSTDKSIKLWNTQEMKCVKSIDTGSQVCNMIFSATSDELVSTHGYSLNSIAVWKVKNMQKIATLQGHSYRVLYLAKSPDNETILTGSGDQTLRFWKIFPSPKDQVQSSSTLDQKNFIIR